MDARTLVLAGAGLLGVLAVPGAAPAEPKRWRVQVRSPGAEPRPQATALRLSETDVLARFTAEVRSSRALRDRALALWQTHFAAQAAELERRLVTDEDWRPVLADAAALVDEYLEASLLPRAGEFRGEGPELSTGKVWIETLDSRTGQRVRQLKDAARRRPLLAPTDPSGGKPEPAPPAGEGAGSRGLRPAK